MKATSAVVLISNYAKNSQGGGIQTFVENLFDRLRNDRLNVYLVARYGKAVTANEKIIPGNKWSFIGRTYLTCLKLKPDVIHSHANWYCIVPALLYRLTRKVKIIHTMHSLPERKYKWQTKFFFSRILARCDNVNFVSFFLRDHFEGDQGIHCPKSSVIYPGSDHVSKNIEFVAKNAFRERFGIDKDAVIILAHGLSAHIMKFQGAVILMEAFARLLVSFPNLCLVFTKKGKFLESMRSKAVQLGVGKHVVFTLDLDRPEIATGTAQIYAHITLGEGGVSIAVLEAMATGTPVVATRTGGIPELLKDQVNAVLAEPSVDAVYNAIKLVIESTDLRESITANALTLATSRYTWKEVTDQFLQLYQSV